MPPPGNGVPPKPTIIAQPGFWNNGNLSLTITSTNNAANLAPAQLNFSIADLSGTPYYAGPAETPMTTGNATVNIFYNDITEVGLVSPGDTLRIQAVPSVPGALHGASLKEFTAGDIIGSTTLP